MSQDNDAEQSAAAATHGGAPAGIRFNATTRAMAALTAITAASGDNKTGAINNSLRVMVTLLAPAHPDGALHVTAPNGGAPTSCICPDQTPAPQSPYRKDTPMSLYSLTPKAGFERYTVQVGWNPHRTFFATVLDFAWDPVTDPDHEPDAVCLGRVATILDPTDVLAAVEPYAVIGDDLAVKLRADKAAHPPRR